MSTNFIPGSVYSIVFDYEGHTDEIRIPITALAVSEDKKNIFTGCANGIIINWNVTTGEGTVMIPSLHDSPYVRLAFANNNLFSVAQNKTMRVTPIAETGDKLHVEDYVSKLMKKLRSNIRDLAVTSDGKFAVVACAEHFVTYSVREDDDQTWDGMNTFPVKFQPSCVAIAPSKNEFILGTRTLELYVFRTIRMDVYRDHYQKFDIIHLAAQPSSLAYSCDGKNLAVATVTGKVLIFTLGGQNKWKFQKSRDIHVGRVNVVSWSPDGRRIATGGFDCNVIVWDIVCHEPPVIIDDAHSGKAINGVAWLDVEILLTVGDDGDVRKWTVPIKPQEVNSS